MKSAPLFLTLLGIPACGDPSPPAREGPPPIILITVESLRTDHVGCYGYSRDTTPNLDAFARDSLQFDNAFSVSSWTLTSHASLFTGLYPGAHQVELPRHRLADEYLTLAEVLADTGYETAGFASGVYLREPYNLQQGFETYDTSPCSPPDQIDELRTSPKLQASIEAFLDHRDPQRPLFLFAYYWDVHYAYRPPPPYDTRFVPDGAEPLDVSRFDRNPAIHKDMSPAQLDYLIGQYDGEIAYTDHYLGKLFALLRERGLWDDAVIVVTSDHGEEFFDHGHKGHKNNLYAETLHVPLWIKLPRSARTGRDPRVVSNVDLFPTLLELAGVQQRPAGSFGKSLLDQTSPGRPIFHELTTSWYFNRPGGAGPARRSDRWSAVRKGPHKLLAIQPEQLGRRFELYDVETDPEELRPVSHPEARVKLEQLLEGYRQSSRRIAAGYPPAQEVQLSSDEEARLRQMGYLQDESPGPASDKSNTRK